MVGAGGVSVGGMLSRALAILGTAPVSMLGVSFAFATLPGALLDWRVSAWGLGDEEAGLAGIMVDLAIGMMLSVIVAGVLTPVAIAREQGVRIQVPTLMRTLGAAALPLVVLGLIVACAVSLGWLLVVPGMAMLVLWAAAPGVLVTEGCGPLAALRRSVALTRGGRWQVLGLLLLNVMLAVLLAALQYLLGMVVMGGMAELDLATETGSEPWPLFVVNATIETISEALNAATQIAIFLTLQDSEEPPATATLADIFR